MAGSTMSKMHRFALLAACLAAIVPSTFAGNPKLLKTTFKSLLLPVHSSGSSVGQSFKSKAAASGSSVDAPTNNAVLKVVASIKTGNNQTFDDVLIDTGSAILWVGGEESFEPGPNTKPYVRSMLHCRSNQSPSIVMGSSASATALVVPVALLIPIRSLLAMRPSNLKSLVHRIQPMALIL